LNLWQASEFENVLRSARGAFQSEAPGAARSWRAE